MADTPVHVLITTPLEETHLHKLRSLSPRLAIHHQPTRRIEDIPGSIWEKTEILYTDVVLPTPEQAPMLRWIQFHWAGIDRLVEAPILREPQVIATTMSGASASQVAEYILTGLLALGHKLPAALSAQKNAEWPADRWDRFSPRELRGSTVGFVGYGSIARQAARLLQPFGANILAAKRDAMHPQDTDYIPEGMGDPEGILARRIYPIQALPTMVKECDYLVIVLPLTAATRGILDNEVFAAIKTGCYLVDVSRGGIVDPAALLKALKSGKLAGAMLDVFPQEPLPNDHPLWKQSNVIITPHISGISPLYDDRAVELFSENLYRYLGELTLYNRYQPDLGY